MIRTDAILKLDDIEGLERLMARFPSVVHDEAQQVFNKRLPQMKQEFEAYPGPSKNGLNSGRPFRWSFDPAANARARRWWFANYPNGRQRTGALAKAYQYRLLKTSQGATITIENRNPGHQWTKGRFRDVNWQIPGHARTGWDRDKETMDFWAKALAEETVREVQLLLDNIADV